MQLRCISIPLLVAEARSDPWQINATLQSGRPAYVCDLAQAFRNAGQCTVEANTAFAEARRHFEAAWNREHGDHPINDSAEVQRAVTSLGVHAAQLPRIAVGLESIGATLAETQQTGGVLISILEGQLQFIDDALRAALDVEQTGHLTGADRTNLDQHICTLERRAIEDTKDAGGQLASIRDGYADYLREAQNYLRIDGYDYDPAATQGLDDDSGPSRGEQDHRAVDSYNTSQRAQDQALVDSPDSPPAAKADAATRLRDYGTATDPSVNADTRRLASERLDDFAMAQFTGPLPVDPILGGDARSRAQLRTEWQKKLEQGFAGGPPMTPDQVTQLLDNGEAEGRVVVTQRAMSALERQGLPAERATEVVGRVAEGVPWAEIVQEEATRLHLAGEGITGLGDSVSTGRHALDALTPGAAEDIVKLGKRLSHVGTFLDATLALNEYAHGAPPGETAGKTLGEVGGGWLGGMLGGALGGSYLGPPGAFVGAIVAAALGEFGGETGGASVGRALDK